MNKKANTYDIFEFVVIVFIVIFAGFAGYIMLDGFITQASSNSMLNSTQNMNFLNKYESNWIKGMDYGVLLLSLLLPILSYYFARKIPTDPIFIIFTLLSCFIIFILLMIFSNVFGGMMDNSSFATFMNRMTFIPFIMPKLPYYGLIYVGLVLIGLFSKTEDSTI